MLISSRWAFGWLLMSGMATAASNSTGLQKAVAALNGLMVGYNKTTGLWDANDEAAAWWQSGIALQATLDFMETTGSRDYIALANYTINTQRAPLAWWPEGGGDFRADSTDDTGWWALAVLTMYSMTGEKWLLEIAIEDEAYMAQYWSTSTCNGGLIWDIRSMTYKNAISNELYIDLTASLHNAIPGDTSYLDRSLKAWEWFKNSSMINSEWLINDGLTENSDGTCSNNGQRTWTYNQGVILGGLTQLYLATSDAQYLMFARKIADAVISSSLLAPNEILTEPCPAEGCDQNGASFKGIFVRYLAKLNAQLSDRPYTSFIAKNAKTMYASNRIGGDNGTAFFGMQWQGPFDTTSLGRQESAVMLLVAALKE